MRLDCREPLFSIVVANYNNGRFLDELYASITRQRYDHWELVIADDCSTDGSRSVISRLAGADARVRSVFHDHNQGVAATFGTAVAHSSGDLVGLLGADDALPPDALSEMVAAFREAPECSLINSNAFHCDANLKVLGLYEGFSRVPEGKTLIQSLTVCNFAVFPRWAYDLTEGFDPFFRKAADHDLFLKLDEVGPISYVDRPLYYYRVTGQGVSQGAGGLRAAQMSLIARRNAQRRRLRLGRGCLSDREFRQMMMTYHSREAYFLRRQRAFAASMAHLFSAFRASPSFALTRPFWTTIVRNLLRRS